MFLGCPAARLRSPAGSSVLLQADGPQPVCTVSTCPPARPLPLRSGWLTACLAAARRARAAGPLRRPATCGTQHHCLHTASCLPAGISPVAQHGSRSGRAAPAGGHARGQPGCALRRRGRYVQCRPAVDAVAAAPRQLMPGSQLVAAIAAAGAEGRPSCVLQARTKMGRRTARSRRRGASGGWLWLKSRWGVGGRHGCASC